jgi:ubiquinone/menaquinone biosynthesis C-methylase UbiE
VKHDKCFALFYLGQVSSYQVVPLVCLFNSPSLAYNYDRIATVYDRLSRLIFGRAQVDAQVYLIKHIPPGASVLIVGGGTGWILEEIVRIHTSGLMITYIDASERMATLARGRKVAGNKITYIAAPIEEVALAFNYDVVLTPFFFDNLVQQSAEMVFGQINERLSANGLWLYCDFQQTGVWWQRSLLRVMYLFFRTLCGIVASRLPDMEHVFTGAGYSRADERTFLRCFIVSRIYKKATG